MQNEETIGDTVADAPEVFDGGDLPDVVVPKRRGRPAGSKNKPKAAVKPKPAPKPKAEPVVEVEGQLTVEEVIEAVEDGPQLAPSEVVDVSAKAQERQTWGPFSDYQYVTTNWGEYGVPKGKVLFFETRQIWNNKEKRLQEYPMPYYVNPGEPLVAKDRGLPDTIEKT